MRYELKLIFPLFSYSMLRKSVGFSAVREGRSSAALIWVTEAGLSKTLVINWVLRCHRLREKSPLFSMVVIEFSPVAIILRLYCRVVLF